MAAPSISLVALSCHDIAVVVVIPIAHTRQELDQLSAPGHDLPMYGIPQHQLDYLVLDRPSRQEVLRSLPLLPPRHQFPHRLQRGGRISPCPAGEPPGGRGQPLLIPFGLVLVVVNVLVSPRLVDVSLGQEPPLVLGAHGAPKKGQRLPCPLRGRVIGHDRALTSSPRPDAVTLPVKGNLAVVLQLHVGPHVPVPHDALGIERVQAVYERCPSPLREVRPGGRRQPL
mmetsp:Transcript_20471/g.43930  ORF Transcript_20471/g.43930 Transcript_20471/m.43930 type:complete len:227 (-) Transcript_20471:674-1354(-)